MSEIKEELLKQLEELLDYLYSHHVNEYEIQITDAVQELPVISVSFDHMDVEERRREIMDNLISRRAAIDVTWEEPTYTDPLNVLTEVRDKIRALPSAERKGKWVLTDYPDEQTYKCSACNEVWIFLDGTPEDNGAFFCPNCGADMRGEQDE